MSPYSMAVAPLSSFRKARIMIFVTPLKNPPGLAGATTIAVGRKQSVVRGMRRIDRRGQTLVF
ncbi:MAG TPA: hypothetical protein VE914_04525 [Candidatus Angelobacter sp.]|nr:hypothetical protein [Candidatus Angelobacter sp.]